MTGMDGEIRRLLDTRFPVAEPRENKQTTLAGAIARHVRPGDAIHLGITHTRWSVACWELLRRYAGTDPRFTFLGVQLITPAAPLVHAGLARRLVTSWAGDSYPSPAPNPVFHRAWEAGVEIENWSIYTFAQRLAAAARGQTWTVTRSLEGSTMAEENRGAYRSVEPGLGLVSALTPDISILHAPAADAAGNVLLAPPLMEDVAGALAARRGAIVTVECVVPTAVVREHAGACRIPASAVAAVVEAPLGAHPGGVSPAGLAPGGLAGVEAYAEDWELWEEIRNASRDPAALDEWIRTWVLETPTHEAYVARLGAERIERLRARARVDTWEEELAAALPEAGLEAPPTPAEEMAIWAARLIGDRVRREGYRSVLAGAGVANLAAWHAAYTLAAEGTVVDLVAEMGLAGYWPRPGEPFLFNQRNYPTCTMLTDIDTALGVLVGGAGARSLGALGAAMVDRAGNINSTRTAERFLMGSGGANDVATTATETIVTLAQTRERFVATVPYITAPGERVRACVSTLGVYEKDERGELVLAGVPGPDVAEGVRAARAACGWELRAARTVRALAPPGREELLMLRLMDPRGFFRR